MEPALLPRILAEFNEMAIGVCEGQQYDMDYEERQKVSVVAEPSEKKTVTS